MSVVGEPPSRFPLGKIISCGSAVLALAVIAIIGAVFLGVSGLSKNSQPYADSIAAAQANEAAIAALGEPIEPGFFVTGSVNIENDSGKANLTIPVSGSKSEGKIKLEGTKHGGIWKYHVWELLVDGNPQPVSLGN